MKLRVPLPMFEINCFSAWELLYNSNKILREMMVIFSEIIKLNRISS